ncbi:MAG: dCMP deaminase [Parcubacteria group bacterium Athens1014_10]|nr:MAG: dCMP deaminase [Parcubacteria group bacterium Athens1014_10]TSD06106.1 MAG: dCMP deaminase [Parcubacteria group bacterium Athens0714_12]
MTQQRPNKDEYYLEIAKQVARRGTCQRRRFGALIVKDDQIISTGYVGAPRKAVNCQDLDICPRTKANIPSGERYELCRSVHAEMNVIINAARAGVSILGGVLYLYGENINGTPVENIQPCKLCKRMIINAGLKEVIFEKNGKIERINPENWIKEEILDFNDLKIKGY